MNTRLLDYEFKIMVSEGLIYLYYYQSSFITPFTKERGKMGGGRKENIK